jgi:hypothetical protein
MGKANYAFGGYNRMPLLTELGTDRFGYKDAAPNGAAQITATVY